MPYLAVDFDEKDDLDETSRGNNGFGSTGTK
jgi:dUTPase